MKPVSVLVIVVSILASLLLCSCVTSKYTEIGASGVRQVDQYDGEQLLGTHHEKYCPDAKGWFEAEKDSSGEWQWTAKGEQDRQNKLRRPSSGGGGNGGSGGGGGGGGCFTPETLVLMADNTTKSIKEIKIGDQVKSFDFQKNEITENKVMAVFTFNKTSYLKINGLEATATHPFCVGKGVWKEAGMLKVGDIVIGENLEKIKIETIEEVQKDVVVYNLTVDGTHNYFVSNGSKNFLVHNKGGGSS